MKVDREMLGLCIQQAHDKHGDDWNKIADDVVEKFWKKEEASVSDISLAIAIVISAYDDKKIPAIKSVEESVGWIARQVAKMNGNKVFIPKLESDGGIGQMVFPPEIYAKAMWIERSLTMYEESKGGAVK